MLCILIDHFIVMLNVIVLLLLALSDQFEGGELNYKCITMFTEKINIKNTVSLMPCSELKRHFFETFRSIIFHGNHVTSPNAQKTFIDAIVIASSAAICLHC